MRPLRQNFCLVTLRFFCDFFFWKVVNKTFLLPHDYFYCLSFILQARIFSLTQNGCKLMCRFISDLNLASWISKTSSLLFLNHVDADNSQFRLALLSNDGSTSERESHQEEIKSEATADIKRSHNLTSSQKRALIVKRLIPLVISLMILGGAVALRFLISLPSSHETSSFGNDTLTANTSHNNLTTNLVT